MCHPPRSRWESLRVPQPYWTAIFAATARIARSVQNRNAGSRGRLKERIDTRDISAVGLVLAVVPAIADDCDTIIDHLVNDWLKTGPQSRKGGFVHHDFGARCDCQDVVDGQQHLVLISAGCGAQIDACDVRDQARGTTHKREVVGDIARLERIELKQTDRLAGSIYASPTPAGSGIRREFGGDCGVAGPKTIYQMSAASCT